jgi:SH3-like domain-containing protein
VKRPSRLVGAAPLLAVLLVTLARAESATTKERARLRQGPSASTELLGELDAGERIDVLGESGGWRQVRTADGRVGYLWSEHLARDGETRAASDAPPPRALGDQVRDLRDDVAALRQRPDPATAADLERVRQELERLAAAERDLARRFDERGMPGPPDPPGEGSGTFGPVFFVVGGIVGFAASRLLQRRRDYRQRSRLRL